MEQPTPSPRRRLRGLRIAGKIILFLLLFIVVLFLALLTPPVQRFATARIEAFLETTLQTPTQRQQLRSKWRWTTWGWKIFV